MPGVLQIAMQHAISLNGVAVVSLSGDVAMQNLPDDEPEHHLVFNRSGIRPSDAHLQQLASLIDQSKKLPCFAGQVVPGRMMF
jgi:pyruvate dehydrogenase (quinone)